MGQMDEMELSRKFKKRQAGKKSKYASKEAKGKGSVVDWREIDADMIREAIACATENGDALMFGATSEGGAYAIHIYEGGERYPNYERDPQIVHHILDNVIKAGALD